MTTGIPALRDWQIRALDEILLEWKADPKAKPLVAACPGSGKTLLTAVLIRRLREDGQIDLAIIVVPTTNVQAKWVTVLESAGLKATDKASNMNLRWRKEANEPMTEGNEVLVVTYAQLAQDSPLLAEAARRAGKTLAGGDEIHHADDEEKYGTSVQELADACKYTLALSGTPFNSIGGALALCDSDLIIDEDGKPARVTKVTSRYSYAEAILAGDCRPVEFIKVYGRGEATYRLLSNNALFKRITDLAKKRKADRLSVLLDPDGEFMEECARQAVRLLAELRAAGDKRAAMLVVAKNKAHGNQMAQLLTRICVQEKQSFMVQEIYNDTPAASNRIDDLDTDSTDIVVSVRMLSEGVDVKRLRVGLFATDWMTRMFFIQFVGRFVRWEDRLDNNQFACVIIPAHIILLGYALEIEKMVESAAIVDGDGEGGGGEKKSEFVEATNEFGSVGVIYRERESDKLDLAEAFFAKYPEARGGITRSLAIKIAEDQGLNGASPGSPRSKRIDWGRKNDLLVRAIVKRLRNSTDRPDSELYEAVQSSANQAVGIKKKDKLTAEETLIKRHSFLRQWLTRLAFGKEDNDAA